MILCVYRRRREDRRACVRNWSENIDGLALFLSFLIYYLHYIQNHYRRLASASKLSSQFDHVFFFFLKKRKGRKERKERKGNLVC